MQDGAFGGKSRRAKAKIGLDAVAVKRG